MCYCFDYYAGWSIYEQAVLVSIRTWSRYMVEQRRGHGPDHLIKQEHIIHFITLIHQRTLSIQTTSLSLPFVYDFVSLSVLR